MQVQEDQKLFLDENFMMGIFSNIEYKALQLKDCLLYIFENNLTDTVGGESKLLPYN